jgi:hypothetical protein
MLLWPAVTLIGFVVLTALVIAMGTRSTARYERETARYEHEQRAVFVENTAAGPVAATTA